jgi:O-antigen/teichoic acid export membrane protein
MSGSLKRRALAFGPGAIIPAALAFAAAAIYTHILSPAQYGLLALALAVAVAAPVFTSQWVVQGVIRYLPAAEAENKGAGIRHGSLRLSLAIALSILFLSALVSIILRYTGASSVTGLLLPVGVLIAATTVLNPLLAIAQSQLRGSLHSGIRTVDAGLRFSLGLAVAVLISPTAVGIVWGVAAGVLLTLPLAWSRLGRGAFRQAWRAIDIPLARRFFAYGAPMAGWLIGSTFLSVGDRFVIQWAHGPSQVGIYSANYMLIAGGAALLASPILLAAHPLLMRQWDSGARDDAARSLGRIIEVLLTGAILLIGPMIVFARDLAEWVLAAEFAAGYPVLAIAFGGTLLWQVGLYLQKPFEFMGRTTLLMGLSVGAALMNIVLNILFVPRFGYLAAAWTTLACCGGYAMLAGVLGRRYLHWSFPVGALVRRFVLMTAAVILAVRIRAAADVSDLSPVLSMALAAVVVGVAGLLLLRSMDLLRPGPATDAPVGENGNRVAPSVLGAVRLEADRG